MAKIQVQLTGEDGNVFNLLGIVTKALKRNGQREESKELAERIWESASYDEALQLFMMLCQEDSRLQSRR